MDKVTLRKFKISLLALAVIPVLLVAFNNCSQNFMTETSISGEVSSSNMESNSSPSGNNTAPQPEAPTGVVGVNDPENKGADLCEKQIRSAFSAGYHQFFQRDTACLRCHNVGPGKGRFANPDLEAAYIDFSRMGYITLGDKAKSDHQRPYTGASNVTTINDLQALWSQTLQEYATCKGTVVQPTVDSPEDRVAFRTASKAIPVMGFDEEKTMTWSMNPDISSVKTGHVMPTLAGAQLIVTISRRKTSSGEPYYLITRPQIKNSAVDVRVKALSVFINDVFLKYPTTFTFVDAKVRQNTTDNTLATFSTGSMAAPGVFSNADTLALGFELIEQTVLPPPAPAMTAQFSAAKTQWVVQGQTFLDIDVVLSRPAEEVVTINVNDIGNKLCSANISVTTANSTSVQLNENATCYPEVKNMICPTSDASCLPKLQVYRARSIVGSSYNRYDWDFILEGTSFVFFPGDVKKTFRIYFSQDIRKEGTRLLTLQMNIATASVTAGTNAEIHFIFNKLINPDPPFGVATFSELMNPMSGILGTRCLECHNSTKLEGGYDMSNYALMRSKNILIPGDVNSKMYMRMNPNADQGNLRSMPLNGFLETQLTREVEQWILNGALNN